MEKIDGRGERILVVEDEADILGFIQTGLTSCGFSVTAATSAEEALSLFNAEEGAFDVVVSDVVLPAMDGVSLARELSRQKPGLPLVLASGYLNDRANWKRIEEEGYRFLQKPFTLIELLKVIADITG